MKKLTLKEGLERRVLAHRIWAGISLAYIGITITTIFVFGGPGRILYIMIPVWMLFGALASFNIRQVVRLRRILNDPLFFLLAVKHDLLGKEESK